MKPLVDCRDSNRSQGIKIIWQIAGEVRINLLYSAFSRRMAQQQPARALLLRRVTASMVDQDGLLELEASG
jgi:hypothetical protein